MAKLGRGYSFSASEQVTETKLHLLVDSGTITDILQSDFSASIAIPNSNLDDIDGSKLTGLANIGAGAGIIPSANLANVNAFIQGMILLWSGSVASIPSGWLLCNGSNGTPDLRDKFIMGAGDTYDPADSGGSATKSIGETNLPSHSHAAGTLTDGVHSHSLTRNSTGSQSPGSYAITPNSCIYTPVTYGYTDSGGGAAVTGSTGAIGSGTALDVLNPYYALAYIYKT